MTLLICCVCQDGIVLTADGRSNLLDAYGHSVSTDRLQKIFPHAALPFAIANHGENRFQEIPVSNLISELLNFQNASGPQNVINRIVRVLEPKIQAEFASNTAVDFTAFWVCGPSKYGFEIHEVEWNREKGHVVRKGGLKTVPVYLAGDCRFAINKYMSEQIDDEFDASLLKERPVEYGVQLSDKLYNIVMSDNPPKCGGHKHQLVVGDAGCRWVTPPSA